MQPHTAKPRPAVPPALERAVRDLGGRLPHLERIPRQAPSAAASRYFAPGEYAYESEWWAKQLGRA